MEAYFTTRQGFSVDRVIADPDLNEQYAATCQRLGLPGTPVDWNQRLMNLRKGSLLKGLPNARPTTFPLEKKDFYRYEFACEIAIQRFETENAATLDVILCNPALADQFDQYVLTMLPDEPSSLKIRCRLRADSIMQHPLTG